MNILDGLHVAYMLGVMQYRNGRQRGVFEENSNSIRTPEPTQVIIQMLCKLPELRPW